jgi:hypothetical protein
MRASAIAILLLIIGLIGNGLGAQVVGWLSDFYMAMRLEDGGFASQLNNALCRNPAEVAQLAAQLQVACKSAYGEGLRYALMSTVLLMIPSGFFFYWCSRTLKRDMLAH